MNNDITSSYEYIVAQKNVGKYRLLKILLIALYILYVLVPLIFIMSGEGALMAPMFALIAVTLWMLVFFTWRYTKPEYEYSVTSGHLTFTVVYNKRHRKEKLRLTLKDCVLIAPATVREYQERLDLYKPEVIYSALSSDSTPDKYFATFESSDGKRCVFYFEATKKMLKICRMYNPSGTVITEVRY